MLKVNLNRSLKHRLSRFLVSMVMNHQDLLDLC